MDQLCLDSAVVGNEIDVLHQLRPVIAVSGKLRPRQPETRAGNGFIKILPRFTGILMCEYARHKHLVIKPAGEIVFIF